MNRLSIDKPSARVRSSSVRSGRGQAMLWSVLSALLLMLLVSGCSPNQKTEKVAVDYPTAKSQTMANERAMAAVIAPEDIVETKQNQVSSLLGCSDGGHLWTGQIFVTLAPGADGPGYLQKIEEAWTGKDDWSVAERTTAQGQAVVDITNDAGYNHGVDYSEKRHAIRIMSFSPCFILDPPYEYDTKY